MMRQVYRGNALFLPGQPGFAVTFAVNVNEVADGDRLAARVYETAARD